MLLNADTVPHTVPYTVPQRMFLTLCALDDAHQTPCTYMVHTFEWLQAMLRISMAPGLPTGIELPQILCYDELETMDTMMWLGMQNVIIVNDRYAQADMHFALQHATCTMEEESLLSKVSPAHVMACKCYSIHSKRERSGLHPLSSLKSDGCARVCEPCKKVVPQAYSGAGTHIQQGGAALPLLSMGSNSGKLPTRRPTFRNLPLGRLGVPLALSLCFQLSLEKWYAHS